MEMYFLLLIGAAAGLAYNLSGEDNADFEPNEEGQLDSDQPAPASPDYFEGKDIRFGTDHSAGTAGDDHVVIPLLSTTGEEEVYYSNDIRFDAKDGDDRVVLQFHDFSENPNIGFGGRSFETAWPLAPQSFQLEGGGGSDTLSAKLHSLSPEYQERFTGQIFGGADSDSLSTNVYSSLYGGSGDDWLRGSGGSELFGGSGDDTLMVAYTPEVGALPSDAESAQEWVAVAGGPGQDNFTIDRYAHNGKILLSDFTLGSETLTIALDPQEELHEMVWTQKGADAELNVSFRRQEGLDGSSPELEPGGPVDEWITWRNSFSEDRVVSLLFASSEAERLSAELTLSQTSRELILGSGESTGGLAG